jgi:hypothetical protein
MLPKNFKLDWDTVKALEKQYMQAQLKRAGTPGPRALGIDEISTGRGHTYRNLCPVLLAFSAMPVLVNRRQKGCSLNMELQKALNPPNDRKVERFSQSFGPGDKLTGRCNSATLTWCRVIETRAGRIGSPKSLLRGRLTDGWQSRPGKRSVL